MSTRANKKDDWFASMIKRILMLVCAGLLVLSYLSMYVNPAKAWYMTIFGLMFVPLCLVNVFLLIWALLRRSWTAVLPLLALLPAFFSLDNFVRFRGFDSEGPTNTANGKNIKIISYNVGRFSMITGHKNWESCADSVMDMLKSREADIICLQEVYHDNSDELRKYLKRRFKGYDIQYFLNINSWSCAGNVIISRYPSKRKGKIDFKNSANMAMWSDYNIGGKKVRIYNCHLQSYAISLPRIAESFGKDYKSAVRDTEEKVKQSIMLRPNQVGVILSHIGRCSSDVIITGDFNDTPMSYTYHKLIKGRKDSFVEAGHGTGGTFYCLGPFLRIDYVLYPPEFEAIDHRVLRRKFSDHYPIETVLRISQVERK